MTDLEKFRFKLGDPIKYAEVYHEADGQTKVWSLGRSSIIESEVKIDGVVQTSGFELDTTNGTLLFSVAPTDGSMISVEFSFAGFTDAEITELLTDNTFNEALVEAIEVLMMDAAKFSNYTFGDTKVDSDAVFAKLARMRNYFADKKVITPIVMERIHPAYEPAPTIETIDLTRDEI